MFKKDQLRLMVVFLVAAAAGLIVYFSGMSLQNQADVETTVPHKNNITRASSFTRQLLDSNRTMLLQADKPSLTQLSSLTSLAAQRKAAMSALIEENPEEFIKNSIPENLVNTFNGQVQSYIEKPVTLEGEVSIFDTDNFKTGQHAVKYLLKDDEENNYELFFTDLPKNILPKMEISISGLELGGKVAIDATAGDTNLQILSEPSALSQYTINNRAAVIFFNFQNNANIKPNLTPIVQEAYYTGTSSVKKFLEEASFSSWTMQGKYHPEEGDYYGWYTVPYNNTSCSLYDVNRWFKALDAELAKVGITTTDYRHFIYIFPYTATCRWYGLAELGGRKSIINGQYDDGTDSYRQLRHITFHELGHNYFFAHANFLKCTDTSGQPIASGGNCLIEEYKDPFDIMGNINIRHPNAVSKGNHAIYDVNNNLLDADWIKSDKIKIVSAPDTLPHSYSLTPMTKPTTGSIPQLILVPKEYDASKRIASYFALEYRKATEFDNGNSGDSVYNGVTIRVVNGDVNNYSYFGSLLIDTTPLDTTNIQSALTEGQTFFDQDSNITIKTTSISDGQANLDITVDTKPCQSKQPAVTITPTYTQALMPGTSQSFTFKAKNENSASCGTQNFNFRSIANFFTADWTITVTPASSSLAPGQTVQGTLTITSPSNARDDYYTVAVSAANSATPYLIGSDAVSYRVDRAITMTPTGKINIANKPYTYSKQPKLYLSAPVSAKVVSYRLSNNGSRWDIWRGLTSSEQESGKWQYSAWNMTNALYGGKKNEGTKKIYVQFRNSANKISITYQDSIIYSPRKIKPLKITKYKFKVKNYKKQYIKIKNRLRGSIILDGFFLKNNKGKKFIIKKFTLKAGKTVTIYARKGKTSKKKGRLYMGRKSRFWKKSHDRFRLYTDDKQLLLSKKY